MKRIRPDRPFILVATDFLGRIGIADSIFILIGAAIYILRVWILVNDSRLRPIKYEKAISGRKTYYKRQNTKVFKHPDYVGDFRCTSQKGTRCNS